SSFRLVISHHGILVMDANTLVARLCSRPSEHARLRERVSYWTKAEMFIFGATLVGRGRSRDFTPRCLLEAAAFNALADLGFPVSTFAMSAVSVEMLKAAEVWAAGNQEPRWLQVSIAADPTKERSGQFTVIPHVGALTPIWLPDVTTMIIIDVTALLRQIQWSREDELAGQEHYDARPPSPAQPRQLGTQIRRRSR